jgi:hypothetical protein
MDIRREQLESPLWVGWDGHHLAQRGDGCTLVKHREPPFHCAAIAPPRCNFAANPVGVHARPVAQRGAARFIGEESSP